MARITYIGADGVQTIVDASEGSVMEAAVKNNVVGIAADCGGACACATCHVIIAPEWVDRLPPPDSTEDAMIVYVAAPEPHSRLSCQIKIGPEIDGLVVRLPISQY